MLGVIENMSHYVCPKCNHKEFIFGENGGKTIAEDMNLEVLGIVVNPFCKIYLWSKRCCKHPNSPLSPMSDFRNGDLK